MIVESIENDKNALNRLGTAVVMLTFLFGTITAFFFFSWTSFSTNSIIWFIANCYGVGVGYHRLFTHESFETTLWVKRSMVVAGCLALQGSFLRWVAIHRQHHKFTDKDGDPHTPLHGAWWAQWFWMLLPNPAIKAFIIEENASELAKDEFYQFMSKYWWLPSVTLNILMFCIGWYYGGWQLGASLVLGYMAQVFIGWQITWSVNSITHMKRFGYRTFVTKDASRNNHLVAFFTFGEGYHNNHHAFPKSAKHGGYGNLDINYEVICLLEKFEKAKKIIVAPAVKIPQPVLVE